MSAGDASARRTLIEIRCDQTLQNLRSACSEPEYMVSYILHVLAHHRPESSTARGMISLPRPVSLDTF